VNSSAYKIEIFPSKFRSSSIHKRACNLPFSSSTPVRQALSLVTIALYSPCWAHQRDVSAYKRAARRQILTAKRLRHVLIKYDRAATHFSAIRRPGSINIEMNATVRSGIQLGSFGVMSVQATARLRLAEQRRRWTLERIV
jgi:hypothetical protein